MCRTNSLSHEAIDTVFYEILRYQDFLRAYLSKKGNGGDSDVESQFAIEQLKNKIEDSFVTLGESAFPLIQDSVIDLSYDTEIMDLVSLLSE